MPYRLPLLPLLRVHPLFRYAELLYRAWRLFEQWDRPANYETGWISGGGCATGGGPYVWNIAASTNCAQWMSTAGREPNAACGGGLWTVGYFAEQSDVIPFGVPDVRAGVWYLKFAPCTEQWKGPLAKRGLPTPDVVTDFAPPGLPEAPTRPRIPPVIPTVIPQVAPEEAPPPGTPQPEPQPAPYRHVPNLPDFSPNGDPVRGPIPDLDPLPDFGWPQPMPGRPGYAPIPTPAPGPGAPPVVPQPSPGTRPRPAPAPGTSPRPGRGPQAGPRPGYVPAVRIEFKPDADPKVERKRHIMTRTRLRTKERKAVIIKAAASLPGKLMNIGSEWCDVVDAGYKALPKKIRKKYEDLENPDDPSKPASFKRQVRNQHKDRERMARGKKPRDPAKRQAARERHHKRREQERANMPWYMKPGDMGYGCHARAAILDKHFLDMDLDIFLGNLAKNQLIDLGIGTLGRGSKTVGEWSGRPMGPAGGPAI